MKKLIIAAAIVCAAAVSQAAATYWTCTYVATAPETYITDGSAFFVVGGDTVRDTILALAGTGAEKVSAAFTGKYGFEQTGDDGKFSVAMANAVENSTLGLSDSTTGNQAFLVIFDTETITDTSNFYVTEVKTFDTMGGTNKGQIKWGDQETASSKAGAWNAVGAVPEPTSGLLLLLGVAGLALRRKQK